MKTSTVFKSRWMALIWAAGILWFAYDVAESAPQSDNSANAEQQTDGTGSTITAEDARKVSDALNGF